MSPAAAIAGALAGLVGAVLPGWIATGSALQGLLLASFPDTVPTLPPFLGALAASALVSVLFALLLPARKPELAG
jgi:DNA-binding transcriptional LysR family regulator